MPGEYSRETEILTGKCFPHNERHSKTNGNKASQLNVNVKPALKYKTAEKVLGSLTGSVKRRIRKNIEFQRVFIQKR